jgi:hypothetical protein
MPVWTTITEKDLHDHLSYQKEWESRWYEEKEVTAHYKIVENVLVLLTVKARYGQGFPRGTEQ